VPEITSDHVPAGLQQLNFGIYDRVFSTTLLVGIMNNEDPDWH
jgi:hypothetical protein